MLRRTDALCGRTRRFVPKPNMERVYARRTELEARRQDDAARYMPPVEPTVQQAAQLYRQLLKKSRSTLVLTDGAYFQKKVRHEFEVTARRTSARVRGIMFEKGQWLVANNLGGLM
jgi:phage/plasmid primase-like uncharacterized protein